MSEEVAEAVEVPNVSIQDKNQIEVEVSIENSLPPEGETQPQNETQDETPPEKIEEKNNVQASNASINKAQSKSKVGSVRASRDDNLNERKSLWNIDQFIQQEIEVGNERNKNENTNTNNETAIIDDDLENQTEEVNYETIAFADPDMNFSDDEPLSLDIDASDVPTCELNKLDVYKTACKIIDVIPVSYYAENMNKEECIMRNHGLGPKGAKAISESLNKTQIQVLDLSGNWIDAGGKYLAKTISDNCYLTELNLSNNHLGIKGGEPMGYMIAQNGSLKILNLSKNNLSNREIKAIADGLKENSMLLCKYL
ncbi:hypothetical protein PIROE2DRAFT_21130 [Piromyces sp. E2]|nr:hypothetical protein PIROE2DRAFT_21130 [Piromyces sp. E2]|eukprot:OUM60158.1 hypothetical protein PIROE2DRAFT_21130 [Piromyces sp. E2]